MVEHLTDPVAHNRRAWDLQVEQDNEWSRPVTPEVVDMKTTSPDDLLIHDEKAANPSLAFLLSRMRHPDFPEPLGPMMTTTSPRATSVDTSSSARMLP